MTTADKSRLGNARIHWIAKALRMNGFNYYNHIAPIYDQTRWMTEAVAEDVADYILKRVGAHTETSLTSFLEPDVGTGLNVSAFSQAWLFRNRKRCFSNNAQPVSSKVE